MLEDFSTRPEGEGEEESIPSYMLAANNHNTGNLNQDWFQGPERSTGRKVANFLGGAALSGINSFYNTAVWAGNMFSDEGAKYRDTRDWIQAFDYDMAQYYDENRQAVDLVGFVATSFVPGLGGVKVLNAGAKALTAAKEGAVGVNMAKGFGILPGSRDLLVKEAVQSFATTRTAFTMSNPQTIKAIAAGFGEQVLQAAAFEVAVAATMKKSPILSDLDAGDMVANITTGALLGGAIGGVLEGAVTVSKLKRGIQATDAQLAGVTQVARATEGARASDEILLRRNDLDTLARNAPEGVDQNLYDRLWENKIAYIDNADRTSFTKLAGGDAELGNRLYEGLRTDPTGSLAGKLFNLDEIAPIHRVSALQSRLDKMAEAAAKKAGKQADETGAYPATHEIRYLKSWGDDMGKISDEAPSALHLADTLKSGEEIKVLARQVQAGKTTYTVQPGKAWSSKTAPYAETLARNIWAMDETVPKLVTPKGKLFLDIGEHDLPMLTKAYREGFMDFQLMDAAGNAIPRPANRDELLLYIADTKNKLAIELMEESVAKGGVKGIISAEQVANQLDTPLGFLTGEQYSTTAEQAIFGLAKAQKEVFDKFHANTVNPPAMESVKPWMKSQNHAMVYSKAGLEEVDNFQVEAIAEVMRRQKIQQETNEVAVLSALGAKARELPELTQAEMQKVTRSGAGAGFFSFANANYGTAGSKAEYVGQRVTRWIQDAQEKISSTFMSSNYAIVNDATEAARLATVMQKVRAAGSEVYVLDDAGEGLILRSVRDYNRAIEAGDELAVPPVIPSGVDETIPLGSDAVRNWVSTHISVNGSRTKALNDIRSATGKPASYDPQAFYPPAPNPDRFKFHAFVVDDTRATSTGHTTMLYADSAQSLEKQLVEARAQGFNVFTPDDSAQYYKARGKYDYSLGLNESQMDSALRRSGSSAPAFPITGSPQEMVQDIMQWHNKQEAIVIREAVSTKYSKEFGVLRQMGEEYSKTANSRIGFFNKIKGDVKNPFEDYVKTFLGASLKKDYPLWNAVNGFVDEAGTKAWNAISSVWRNSKSPYDLNEVNKILDSYGMQMAATPAQMEAWATHPAGTAVVSKFIQNQNAILSSLVLRLDPMNAINNAAGSTILVGAETKALSRAIMSGNAEAAGELTKLLSIQAPGVDDMIRSPAKLIASAYKNFFSEGGKELIAKYKKLGFITDNSTQFKQLIETATIEGTETAAQLESKLHKMYELGKKLGDTGEKWTGNKIAEEMNRFTSANIMDQMTSIAVKHGIMDQATANSYINTFVNRTQGNIIASQRPQVFQGPIGQAIGLFQSYQFNIMQQLLRYVGEGSKKDALTLMGLQSTVYGMNGLPGFQAINQHIIGTASGNTSHTDAYNSTYNIVGKNAGDWLMYGVASNMFIDPDLKVNLYSRGDINPRQVTIVPTNLADVAVVGSWSKLLGSVKNSVSSVQNGGDIWNSILSGVEQQGINRPLAGLAKVARGASEEGISFSTSGNGNVVSANDFYSLANFARLSGAKPFDEAVTQDAVFRVQAYQAVDKAKRDSLGKAVKSVIAGGGEPTAEQMNAFIEKYAASGGKQEEFNKWYVAQVKAVQTPMANKLAEKVDSPYAAYMQSVMGGRLLATPATLARPQPQEEYSGE